jgi:L-lysine 2,3-aminomutase
MIAAMPLEKLKLSALMHIAKPLPPDDAEKATGWQAQMQDAFTDLPPLLRYLQLTPTQLESALGWGMPTAESGFALRVPKNFAARMQPGNPRDPLLLQVLPMAAELLAVPGYAADPVGDLQKNPVPGLIHKYQSRVLLITTGACAVHCRYCFRREFPYAERGLSQSALAKVVEYIASQPAVNEVILSGGDPLSLSNARLLVITDALKELPQLTRIRIHTRTPVVLPSRIDDGFLRLIKSMQTRFAVLMVLHSNHAQEWQSDVLKTAVQALHERKVTLLNQAVLLKTVNDNLPAQVALAEALFANSVLPYYLNQLDQVSGSAHFQVSDASAIALHEAMRRALPGFLLPRLVQEQAGRASKTPLVDQAQQ